MLIESAKGGDEVVRRLELARWSLVPSWSKQLRQKYPTFNVRSEEIPSKAIWRRLLKIAPGSIPASGYFEWTTLPDGKKMPHYIHDPSGRPLALAGLYSWCAKTLESRR